MRVKKGVVFLSLIVAFLSLATLVYAMSAEEKSFLSMYFTDEELQVVSTTRSLKSITRVAENVEVVTKADIELMNAHTLADVLNTVNGVVSLFLGASPGSIGNASIEGSHLEQVVVFMDGIPLNLIASDQADIASIPVQMIEKVEVIKGPASSAWGSSLGGIVNIITKNPPKKEGVGGLASASYGKKDTGDFRAEVSGRKNDFGFYLYAGRLQTDGLRPEEEIHFDDLYAKFTYDVTSRTNIGATFFYNNGSREIGEVGPPDSFVNRREDMFATLNLNSNLSEGLDLNLSLRAARQRFVIDDEMTNGELAPLSPPLDDRKYGASARLTYKTGIHDFVVGSDYDYKKEISDIYANGMPELNVFAIYANDTLSFGKFSVTPGLRYDHTDRNDDIASPSLGGTWEFVDKTLLRLDVARGFHLPNLALAFLVNPGLKPEKVWSYQAGIESTLLKYLWLKVSAFRHDIKDAIVDTENLGEVRRQGVEVEFRSMKFYNFTLSSGIALVRSKDLTTGETIHDVPDYTYDVSLKYDDEKSFRALLIGRYIWWSVLTDPTSKTGVIFDLNLIKTVLKKESRSCELFLTGHNIFDGSEYEDAIFKNARRWVEAGVRYKF